MDDAILNIKRQFVDRYKPNKLLLFGSYANDTAGQSSDIDLCVVIDTKDKRNIIADMYMHIVSEKAFDLLVYTPTEWSECVNDVCSFAYKIHNEGITLYG